MGGTANFLMSSNKLPVVLTIAGTDPSGGAGIQVIKSAYETLSTI